MPDEVGPVIVDSHTHVASPDTKRFPMRPQGFGSDWWRTAGGSAQVLDAMDAAGVDLAVVVQAVGPYGFDCACAIDAVQEHGDRFRFVGAVDTAGPDPVAALARLADTGLLRGVRLFGVGATEATWLTDGTGRDLWDAAADLGTTIIATVFDRHLADLRTLVEQRPDVRVALDHCGFPDVTGGPPFAAAAGLFALADLRPLHLKATTHLLHEGADPADVMDALVGAFGADRVAWGSDFPQTTELDYPGMVDLARRAVRRLPNDAQNAVLGGTAARLWA